MQFDNRLPEENYAAETLKKLRSVLLEVIAENVELANSVHVLEKQYGIVLEERDSARWEVCELASNGSIDGAKREAESRGWDCLGAPNESNT